MLVSPANPRLILASSSKYRQELLSRLHLPFEVMAPHVDESAQNGEAPATTALRLARNKAAAIAALAPDALVIGSDQVATLDGLQIGKPGSHEKAMEQLRQMRGKRVIFHTALCLWDGRALDNLPKVHIENVQTSVTFRNLPDHELEAYLRIEQPYDCAGSAKNEGLGIAILEKIESTDPSALTGLPLIALTGMLRAAGVQFFTA